MPADKTPKSISLDELKELANSAGADARFAKDLLANITVWQQMPDGSQKDEYAKRQHMTAMGVLGCTIKELDSALRNQMESSSKEHVHGESQDSSAKSVAPGPAPVKSDMVNSNIVETKAVFLETADLRALREEDLAQGKKGGPAEQFLGLLDNFRKILKPGKEQEAAVRRVKRMALSLLSVRLQELQTKRGTTGDAKEAGQSTSTSDSDLQFILELKQKSRGESAQHKAPAQFYERRQSLAEWVKELSEHVSKLNDIHKPVDVNEKHEQPVGLNAALNRGASNIKAILHTETEIRKALAMMPEKEIRDLLSGEQYKPLVNDLLYNVNISSATRQAAAVLLSPGWQKSSESVRQLAIIAIKDNSFELLKSTCRYCSPEVRNGFRQTAEAAQAQKTFSIYGKHLNEVLLYGRESLTTQLGTAEGFAYGWFGLANKEEIKKFVDKASPEDRSRYLLGEKLSNKKNLDTEEKVAVSFYKEVDAALRAATNPVIDSKQYDLLRNKLIGGEDIYSALRELHKDEYFGLMRSNDMKGMRRAIELLSLRDWNNMRENPLRFADLSERLKKFLNSQEHREIIGMLKAKIGTKGDGLTYEESQKRGRVPFEIAILAADPESWNAVWNTQNTNQYEKLQSILQMSQLEVNSYLKDRGTPRYLDTLVEAQLTDDAKLVAERTLRHALQTGKMETDEISKTLLSRLSGESLKEQLQCFESILARPGVMSRLRTPQDAETSKIRACLDQIVRDFVEATRRLDFNVGKIGRATPEDYSRKIFETGTIPIDLKILLKPGSSLSLHELYRLSADEKAALIEDKNAGGNLPLQEAVFKSQEQKEFVRFLFNTGKKEPTDSERIRAAVLGLAEDKGKLLLRLSAMNQNELRRTAKIYKEEFNASLPHDLLVGAAGRQRLQARELWNEELSLNLIPKGVHKALDALSEFCKQQRAEISELAQSEQEFFEELCFNYALCREIETISASSGISISTVPVREAILLLARALHAPSSGSQNAGRSAITGPPKKNIKLTLVKSIMGGDFDHSHFTEACEGSGVISSPALQEVIASNFACLRIAQRALEIFEPAKSKRLLQMLDVLQKRITDMHARAAFLREFEPLLCDEDSLSALNKTNASVKPLSRLVSKADKFWLAEQILCESAFPNNVKPGISNDTNTVTIACNLLCDNKPSSFVHLLAEAAIYDRIETTDGTIIRPSEFGAFVDDLDIVELRNKPCLDDYSDLVGTVERPVRNLAGKILQTVLSNVYWKRHAISIAIIEEKGAVRLAGAEDVDVQATQFGKGEVRFVSTEFGHELRILRDGRYVVLHEHMNERTPVLVPSRNPRIEPDYLPDIYNQVVLNQGGEPEKVEMHSGNSEATSAF
jgi:hypothetical protein